MSLPRYPGAKPGSAEAAENARLHQEYLKREMGNRPGPMPEPPRTPIKNVSPQRPVLPPRPGTPPRPQVTVEPSFPRPETPFTPQVTVAPSFGQLPKPGPISVGRPPPQQPNVMGFPDMDPRLQQFAGRLGQEAMQQMFGRPTSMPPTQGPRVQQAVNMERGLTMGPRVQQAVDMERGLTGGAQVQRGVDMMNKAMNNAQQFSAGAAQNIGNKVKGFFKKGGAVTTKAKAPVKKAAGGKVAAKAPVKKAMGGPIKAKAVARPAAKMAKPMPAMKRGGKVMAKGRKK